MIRTPPRLRASVSLIVAAGLASLSASCPSRTYLAEDGAGGVAASLDGRLVLTIPPGALPASTSIRISRERQSDPPPMLDGLPVRGGYRLEPDGLHFARPVRVELTIPKLPDFRPNSSGIVRLYSVHDGTVEPLQTQLLVDAATGHAIARAEIEHFSVIRWNYDDELTLTAVVPEAAYLNAQTDIAGNAFATFLEITRRGAQTFTVKSPQTIVTHLRNKVTPETSRHWFRRLAPQQPLPPSRLVLLRCARPGTEWQKAEFKMGEVVSAAGESLPDVSVILAAPIQCLTANMAAQDVDGANHLRAVLRPLRVTAPVGKSFDMNLEVRRIPRGSVRVYFHTSRSVAGPVVKSAQGGDLELDPPTTLEHVEEVLKKNVPAYLPDSEPIEAGWIRMDGAGWVDATLSFTCLALSRTPLRVFLLAAPTATAPIVPLIAPLTATITCGTDGETFPSTLHTESYLHLFSDWWFMMPDPPDEKEIGEKPGPEDEHKDDPGDKDDGH